MMTSFQKFHRSGLAFEIRFLGVPRKLDNRRPAKKKIRDPIFRGAKETGEPETGREKIRNPIFRGAQETGEPETG